MRAEDAPDYPTCPDCARTLELHELDPTGPGCLLGWCPACRAIFPVLISEAGAFAVAGRATLRIRPPRRRRAPGKRTAGPRGR